MISRKVLKIHKWWSSHFVVMMGAIYFVLAVGPAPPPVGSFLLNLGVFTLASIGIASFGQLLNDATDVRQDVRSGAHNLVAARGTARRAAMFVAVLVVGIVPWFWLPTTPLIAALIAAEFALFILYSVPPVRLKERGLAGTVADALYGYVVPTTVAALLFVELSGGQVPVAFVAALSTWALMFGLLGIIDHQLSDESRDRHDGVRTLVVTLGWSPSFRWAQRLAATATLAAMIGLIVVESISYPLFAVGLLAFLAWTLGTWRHRSLWHTAWISSLPGVARYHLVYTVVLGDFMRLWHPLLALAALTAHAPEYLPIGVLHLISFPSGPGEIAKRLARELRYRLAASSV
jgi:1,4-dihydroxy-2-naphthoate octaprenyltransferase